MTGFPTNWVECRLGDLIEFKYGKSLPARSRCDGAFSVFGSNGQIDTHNESLTAGPTIVIGRKGSIGEVHFSPSPCFPIDTTYYVDEFFNLDEHFVEYLLHTLPLTEMDRASAIPGLNRDDAYALVIGLPPLAEQRRIVAKLDALFARTHQAREELEHIPTLIEHYKQAILAVAFRGELTADWREQTDYEPASVLLERILNERRTRWETEQLTKYKEAGKTPPKNWEDKYQEPEAPDISNLPDLPDGWCWVAIGQVFGVYVGSTPSRKKSEYWNGDIHWVSSGEVAFCRIETTRECITQLGLENASTTIHPVGTVLLGMIGEGKTRGQAAILDIPACHNQNSAAIRVSEAGLPAEYIYYFFQGTYEQTRRKGAGNNQPALNKTRVEAMTIPLPPLDEQIAIVQIIEDAFEWLDIVLDETTRALRLLDYLDQANLAKAFRGELVPQDPDDEPASVLLERIRAARAAGSDGSKRKKRG
jgi:type I restriction enzyme, S subunit